MSTGRPSNWNLFILDFLSTKPNQIAQNWVVSGPSVCCSWEHKGCWFLCSRSGLTLVRDDFVHQYGWFLEIFQRVGEGVPRPSCVTNKWGKEEQEERHGAPGPGVLGSVEAFPASWFLNHSHEDQVGPWRSDTWRCKCVWRLGDGQAAKWTSTKALLQWQVYYVFATFPAGLAILTAMYGDKYFYLKKRKHRSNDAD